MTPAEKQSSAISQKFPLPLGMVIASAGALVFFGGISYQFSRLETTVDLGIEAANQRWESLEEKVDDGFKEVKLAIDKNTDQDRISAKDIADRFRKIEERLTRLEAK